MNANSRFQAVPRTQCSYPHWQLVLQEAGQSPKHSEAIAHVEKCEACQFRLETHSTHNIPWWGEAKESWLEEELPLVQADLPLSSVTIEFASEMPEDSRVEFETVMLSFLEPPSHPELLGRLGRYEIERVIGTGGMGIVLKAHDTELHRVVAIKILAAHLANSASARKRFAREAQAAAAVLHPNVIPIYNVESEGKLPYLVMQCVSGRSLQAKVDRYGMLPLTDTLRIAKQTAAGLAAAHDQGLVHRDVKPANILLEENVDRVILSDFGLARAVDDASLTRTGVVAGTPHYMSPEQAQGVNIDTRSDQFSLGSVMYFMLTGRPPFRATGAMAVLHRICNEEHRSIEQINELVPSDVATLIDRLLAKNPKDRFDTMHQVETEIERLLAALQSGGLSLVKPKRKNSIGSLPPLMSWLKRSMAMSTASMLVLSIAAIVLWPFSPALYQSPIAKPSDVPWTVQPWNTMVKEDLQLQSELDRIGLELDSILRFNPRSFESMNETFNREVHSIESQLLRIVNEMQVPSQFYDGEKQ